MNDVAFFLAPDDGSAADAHRGGPQGRHPSVTGRHFYGDDAVDEWGAYFGGSAQPTYWVVTVTNDGSGTFALPPGLTTALAGAGAAQLGEIAARWAERLRREDGDDMTDDDLPAIVRGVAELARRAAAGEGRLYCWFY